MSHLKFCVEVMVLRLTFGVLELYCIFYSVGPHPSGEVSLDLDLQTQSEKGGLSKAAVILFLSYGDILIISGY